MDEITCPLSGEPFYGQDAQYASNEPSYQDNGDGTITDLNTGLMWVQDPGAKMTYSEAVSGAGSFEYAGYDDWRAPTIKELYSLIEFSGIDVDPTMDSAHASSQTPFIDDDVFVFEYGDNSIGDRIIDSQWVTTSIYVADVMNNQECFFGVNFADGRIKCYPTGGPIEKGYFVRYVRGDAYGENEFISNNDGTVTDSSTGLMWQQSDSSHGMNWESALSYCEGLELADYSDWRLPNAKELQYIVDYSRSPSTTNSAAIDPVFSCSPITDEGGDTNYPFYWTSTTHVDFRGGASAAYIAFGSALGFMQSPTGAYELMDVHGAGAQRSDPKVGDASEYPYGRGPQGDVIRIENYVRCVRG
ncbi:MAG: DUF1566 domain-containing protein [bacterium]|nr:DUF1566 domain-containing protein [bacterium]